MLTGLILAAGESSRMGKDKALLAYRGQTFLEHIVATLREAGIEGVAVVLGHHAEEIQRATKLSGAQIVINQDYLRGQTSSLQAGLRAIEKEDVSGVVLCLVDHPVVSAEVIRKLLTAHQSSRAPVIIPTYEGKRGHPVVMTRELFGELLALKPDQGANTVVRKYRAQTHLIEVADAGVLVDVDDAEAYRKLAP